MLISHTLLTSVNGVRARSCGGARTRLRRETGTVAETRRDRLRAATVREISQTARRILVDEGPQAVTLRAIARAMGMTAPALYRYFDSRDELLRHVVGDMFNELTDELQKSIHAVPKGDMAGKFLAAARGFRVWALAHRRGNELAVGAPGARGG